MAGSKHDNNYVGSWRYPAKFKSNCSSEKKKKRNSSISAVYSDNYMAHFRSTFKILANDSHVYQNSPDLWRFWSDSIHPPQVDHEKREDLRRKQKRAKKCQSKELFIANLILRNVNTNVFVTLDLGRGRRDTFAPEPYLTQW